jgi:hemoglobin-like flavoprotein
MNQETITIVQSSWQKVLPAAPQAGMFFYENLFAADPGLKPLFKGNIATQSQMLMTMIDAAVGKLNDLEALVPVLQQLAKRHVAYGAQEAHYATVGSALLKTLEQGLGNAFTPDVKAAWTDVYGVMASVMILAAKSDS